MHKSILRFTLLVGLALVTACGDSGPPAYTIIDGVPDEAVPVRCDPVVIADEPVPTEIRLVTDSTWSILDGSRGEILELDEAYHVLTRTVIPEQGPGAAGYPVSVAAVGDSAWAIAARDGLSLVVLSRAGKALSTVPLDFVPYSLEAVDDGEFLLTAMPFGTKPPTLLVRITGSNVEPVPVPRRAYEDMTVNALGNTTLVESLPDSGVLVVHQFMEPRAFRMDPNGDVVRVPVPTPKGTRKTIDFIPHSPLTDDQMPLTLVPAIAMGVDPTRGDVYLLTRSGRERDGRPERVVLRSTRDLEFLEGFVLDVPASGMVYLPRTRTAVVHDDADRFFACPLARPADD